MKRLNNGHIISTSQTIKPSEKKIVENMLMTLKMANGIAATNEVGSIVIKQEKPVQLKEAVMTGISIIPSIMLLVVIGVALFHLGWKMSFMALLFAPLPTFIKLMNSFKKTKRIILILPQWVKIYASLNEKPGIWLLMICISVNKKYLIRQWKLQTSKITLPVLETEEFPLQK